MKENKKCQLRVRAKRILIVDDEEQMRSKLRLMLEGAGYDIMEAPDGKIALWLYKEKPVDLIITCFVMTSMAGVDAVFDFNKTFPEVKVLAISGEGQFNSKQYDEMAEEIGTDVFLSKPFENDKLLKAVKDLLSE